MTREPIVAALALLSAGAQASSDVVASILFQNQCGFEVNIYDGDEHFCDLRNGTAAAPSFGCATKLPRELAEYSHSGADNATTARFLIDDASNNTYYELSDEPGEDATTGFNVALEVLPLVFRSEGVGFTSCANVSCLEDGCASAYHSGNDTTGKTYGCPQGEVFLLVFCATGDA